eukprot:1666660-Alexandrium_andersonii.AAC.1
MGVSPDRYAGPISTGASAPLVRAPFGQALRASPGCARPEHRGAGPWSPRASQGCVRRGRRG